MSPRKLCAHCDEHATAALCCACRLAVCEACALSSDLTTCGHWSEDPPPSVPAVLITDGWAGRIETPVWVIGATRCRYRVRNGCGKPIRLGGRDRWLAPLAEALVPRRAVRFGAPHPGRESGAPLIASTAMPEPAPT